MGYGDALLAAGIAERAYREAPELGLVQICHCDGTPRWREEWENNPAILPPNHAPTATTHRITVGPDCLPYHPWNTSIRWRAQDYPTTMHFNNKERRLSQNVRREYGPFLLIEPPGKDRKNPNRHWPGWSALAHILRARIQWPIFQLQRAESVMLPGLPGLHHRNFREACAILQAAEYAVLTEGGISIAAAAVGTPAVVLWGGCCSVETAGYPQHINLVDDDPRTPCMSSRPCQHCAAAWAKLTPESVADVVIGALDASSRRTA